MRFLFNLFGFVYIFNFAVVWFQGKALRKFVSCKMVGGGRSFDTFRYNGVGIREMYVSGDEDSTLALTSLMMGCESKVNVISFQL